MRYMCTNCENQEDVAGTCTVCGMLTVLDEGPLLSGSKPSPSTERFEVESGMRVHEVSPETRSAPSSTRTWDFFVHQ